MQKYKNITNLVGNTPLIKLKKASEITGCNILGKAEYLNPGQSIKDRAALYMIKNAKENKRCIFMIINGVNLYKTPHLIRKYFI